MKWIVLAGPSNTGKTYTLSEVVLNLLGKGGKLDSNCTRPTVLAPGTATQLTKYKDDIYELTYKGKRVVIATEGDYPSSIEDGFNYDPNADVVVSASRSRTNSYHLQRIDALITGNPSVEPCFVAALDHKSNLMRILTHRINQIVNMIY